MNNAPAAKITAPASPRRIDTEPTGDSSSSVTVAGGSAIGKSISIAMPGRCERAGSRTDCATIAARMDLGLSKKIAMVGGASKGLGYAVARALAADGAQISI